MCIGAVGNPSVGCEILAGPAVVIDGGTEIPKVLSRIGISGSSGFLGSAVAQRLETSGIEVVRFVRPQSASHEGLVVEWEPENGVIDGEALRRIGHFDAVIHLAGAGIADHRWSDARKNQIRRSRIDSTELLSKALSQLDAPPELVISASAIGIYGSRGDEILTESSSSGSGFLAEVCKMWEASTRSLELAGIRTIHLRTGIVLSRRGGALAKQLALFRSGVGGRLGSGRQWMSAISLSDLLELIVFLTEINVAGAVNAVAPQPTTNALFTKELAHALHRPAMIHAPRVALGLALGRELVDEVVLSSQRVIPECALGAGFVFRHPDIESMIASALSD